MSTEDWTHAYRLYVERRIIGDDHGRAERSARPSEPEVARATDDTSGTWGDDRRVKLGIIGDAHLGCADYTEKRRADFAVAFKNAVEVSLAKGAEAICFLGDVFDSALMRRNVEAFAKFAKVGVDDVLTGKFPAPGTCPHCGHHSEPS